MRRSMTGIVVGFAFVLVGGYFLAHDAFGFVLPQIALSMPSIDVAGTAGQVSSGIALIRWNLVWPLALVLLGALLLSDGWRTRVRSR